LGECARSPSPSDPTRTVHFDCLLEQIDYFFEMNRLTLKPSQIEQMKEAAESASRNAYCPYSHFAVGAAVFSSEGKIFAGCNVENASFGLTICAERNAIFQAIACGHRKIQAIV